MSNATLLTDGGVVESRCSRALLTLALISHPRPATSRRGVAA
jgi:hypothetical protein